VKVKLEPSAQREGSLSAFVPSLYLLNVMSLAPKIDEIRHVASYANLDCICVTETWLKSRIRDNVVAIDGFNLVRRDRVDIEHCGVCVFIRNRINSTTLEDVKVPNLEVLWIKLRPARLPRGYCSIVIGTVYHPSSANASEILQYLNTCLSSIESRFSNCGILLGGDLNRLRDNYSLKQF